MAKSSTPRSVTVTRRRGRLRWYLLAGVGLVLGAVIVFFFARIHNPFGAELSDPLNLVPDDVDFVVSIPDFPEFLGRLRHRDFVSYLQESEGFSGFLESDRMRETQIVPALRDAFRQLDEIQSQLPLDLDLFGDVSGRHVVLAGYVPRPGGETDDDEWRFMIVFRPDDWKVLAGVNVLLDESLFDLGVKDSLGDDLAVTHTRDAVALTPKDSQRAFHLTRIADAVIVSTEGRQLSRIHTAVQTEGIPSEPQLRFLDLARKQIGIPASSLVILASRDAADRAVGLEDWLAQNWAPSQIDLARSALPAIAGDDVVITLDVEEGLTAALGGPEGVPEETSLSALYRTFSEPELRDVVDRVGSLFPQSAFAMMHLRADAGRIMKNLVERPDYVTDAEREEFDAWLARHPVFRSREGFFATLSELATEEISVVFFTQEREANPNVQQVGWALVTPLRDEEHARSVFEDLENYARRSRGEGLLKDIVRTEFEGVSLYELVVSTHLIEKPEVTRPGMGIIKGHLVLTNWTPILRDQVPEVLAGRARAFKDDPGVQQALLQAPSNLRMATIFTSVPMIRWLNQSVAGWAKARTSPDVGMQQKQRTLIASDLARTGLSPGSTEFDRQWDFRFEEWLQGVQRSRPQEERDLRKMVGHFDGVFQNLGLYFQEGTFGIGLGIRLDIPGSGVATGN